MAESGKPPIFPVRLQAAAGDRLVIEWNDSVRHELTWSQLRKHCPCAGCRMDRDKPPPLLPIIKPEEAQPARAKSIQPVGRYAYQIVWSDGHDSGIYTFEHLRQLGEQSSS